MLKAYCTYTLLGAVKIMETKKIVELILESSNYNPYTGMLSKKDNLIAAIDLAKLCKDFADKGQMDEAINIPSEQCVVVIAELECMMINCAPNVSQLLEVKNINTLHPLLIIFWDFMDKDCKANRNEYTEEEQNEILESFISKL